MCSERLLVEYVDHPKVCCERGGGSVREEYRADAPLTVVRRDSSPTPAAAALKRRAKTRRLAAA